MKFKVWSMYDKRTHVYESPKMYRNDDLAYISVDRQLLQAYENKQITKGIVKDYQLVELATYDDETGDYEPIPESDRKIYNFRIPDITDGEEVPY